MCKTVIPVTVLRQHTPPWCHQQLRTSISKLSELSLFENKVETRIKSKKAKIDLIKKNWSNKQKIDIYWLYNFISTDPTTVKFCFYIFRVIFYIQKKNWLHWPWIALVMSFGVRFYILINTSSPLLMNYLSAGKLGCGNGTVTISLFGSDAHLSIVCYFVNFRIELWFCDSHLIAQVFLCAGCEMDQGPLRKWSAHCTHGSEGISGRDREKFNWRWVVGWQFADWWEIRPNVSGRVFIPTPSIRWRIQ